jgi:dipeptidyl-peptidase 4
VEDLPARLARTRRFSAGAPTDLGRVGGARGVVRFRRDGDLFEAGPAGERLLARGVDAYHGDALVRDGELWTLGGGLRRRTSGGRVTRVRSGPGDDLVAYAGDGALRVLGRAGDLGPAGRDFAWSPDGTRLLVTLVDESHVPRRHGIPYAVAGEPPARVTLAVAGLDGERVEIPVATYLVRAGWDRLGPYAVTLSRDQREVRFLALDPPSGATRVVHAQRGEPWVGVVPGLPARLDDGTVIAHADIGDTRHLTVGGEVVTPTGLQVRAVLAAGSSGEIVFAASREPDATRLWAYGDRLRCLSAERGTVQDGEFVHFGTPGRVTVLRSRERPVPVQTRTEMGGLRAYRIGLKRASLMMPSWHRAGVVLPVLLDPYGGPTRQRVAGLPDWRDLVSEWFAEHGFAVLIADGAGTPGGGPQDERRIHGDLYTEPINDQIGALHEAASVCPDLDLRRVGIRGWSFGGSLAMAAVLRRPDVFHAAVAGAAVTDQRLYFGESRERYLGDPAAHPQHYDRGDLAADAPNLTRPLLLMHGLADTNVLPEHTARMVAALTAAGREHEVVYLPGTGHSAIGSPATPRILQTQLAFLRRHLGPSPGPESLRAWTA